MKREQFNLYFFYRSRKKVRESHILYSIPFNFKERILSIYKIGNYKIIDFGLLLVKLIIISFLYFTFIVSNQIPIDVVIGVSIGIFIFIYIFMILILLNYNEQVTENIDKDHYFRMLGNNRNDFQKEVILKRIRYAYFNWLIPLTIFPFIYLAFQSEYIYLVAYIMIVSISYFINSISIFLTQKIIFVEMRNLIIIDSIFISFVIGLNILLINILADFPIYILIKFSDIKDIVNIIYIVLVLILFSVELIILNYILKKTISYSFNYSITSAIIMNKDSGKKVSSFSYPNLFLRIISSRKNTLENYIVTKDFVSLYRKNKKQFLNTILLGINSLIYSAFIIAAFLEDEFSFTAVVFVDAVFMTGIAMFFTSAFYKFKHDTWYSCEGLNTRLYSKFKISKYTFYKAKKKVNYILLAPIMLLFMLPPLFAISFVPNIGVIYMIARVLYIYLLFTVIMDYSLYMDTKYPRKNKFDPVSGIGGLNIGIILFLVNGVGFLYLFNLVTKLSEYTMLSTINLEYMVSLSALLVVALLKVIYIYKSKSLKTIYEGEKIYG